MQGCSSDTAYTVGGCAMSYQEMNHLVISRSTGNSQRKFRGYFPKGQYFHWPQRGNIRILTAYQNFFGGNHVIIFNGVYQPS
jgi:hypothetical protein